jgi:uncharacterized protein (TIGR03067 family)
LRVIWYVLLSVSLTAVGCQRPVKTDGPTSAVAGAEGMEGTWDLESRDKGDGPITSPVMQLVASKERLVLRAPDGETHVIGEVVRIDPSRTPPEIDLRNDQEVKLGIYEVNGDTLLLVVNNSGARRPTEFKGSRSGSLLKFKRAG